MTTEFEGHCSERGSTGVKVTLVILILVLVAHAGINYIPVAYNGASFRQEMDTAVVKGLATGGQLKPMDVVTAHIQRAARQNDIPQDAVIEVKVAGTVVTAHAVYSQDVNILPFGLYKYKYNFNYLASPTGYLTKQ